MVRKVEWDEIPVDIKNLLRYAKKILASRKLKDWLWNHTASHEHYDRWMEVLMFLEDQKDKFVSWEE